jgi:hypothetical protein
MQQLSPSKKHKIFTHLCAICTNIYLFKNGLAFHSADDAFGCTIRQPATSREIRPVENADDGATVRYVGLKVWR